MQPGTNSGYTGGELTRIGTLLDQHRDLLLEAWHEFVNR
ncbi:MAG: hypothetical protein AVDCRST_MAG18-2914 [uncultured Thermomicrobiales bacterium]|uniref:Uncharacterized protein n=1 Tax=uncultured Thermomicrobiales bacterium TaxID=1645740 RepID=A0A6J4VGX5_9BACT|nr:MAG: hypothetical protein AVDCRST_MAG18-2914 [uncultured Thermomicrobiales bacterium]